MIAAPPVSRTRRRRLLGVLACAWLSGCTLVGVTYDNAQWLLLERTHHFLDLDWSAKKTVLDQFRVRMEAHRAAELPRYVTMLRHVRAMAADGLDAEEIDWTVDTAHAFYRRAVADSTALAAGILADTDPDQHRHLGTTLAEMNQAYRAAHVSLPLGQRIRQRGATVVEELVRWLGPLREHQVRLVWDFNARIPDSSEPWLAYNERRQEELVGLLESGAPAGEIRRHLGAWWVDFEGRTPLLEARLRQSVNDWKRLAVELDRTLSPAQRARLLTRLDALITELESRLTGPVSG